MEENKRGIREELPGFVTLYDDGSVERHASNDTLSSHVPCNPDLFVDGVATADLTLYEATGLWARIFLPGPHRTARAKLPVVLYFHGGGFCIGSPSWKMFHGLCSRMAATTGSMWVSVAYRLAPEHRLPEGCEDCIAALDWLNGVATTARPGCEPLSSHGNFESCFLAGDSVGGNLAHQVAVSAARSGGRAVKILGVILMHPGFVKEERSRSEMENPPHLALVSMEAVEKGSNLALPEGGDKNYYVMNPWIPDINELRLPPVLVVVGKMDIFYDRQMEYFRGMKEGGQDVELVEYSEMGHCFVNNPEHERCPEAFDLVQKVINFMKKCQLLTTD